MSSVNKRFLFLLLACVLNFHNLFAQLSFVNVKKFGGGLQDVLDQVTGEVFAFKKVSNFHDGSRMSVSKCDNVIYISYKGEFFKRVYSGPIDIRWFGCNESRADNQLIINEILRNYQSLLIPEGIFKISGTINVPEGGTITGTGRTSIIRLVANFAVDALIINRGATIKSLKLDCTQTAMDLKSAILVKAWHKNASIGEEVLLQDLTIHGNYPHLQGVAINLSISDGPDQYSLIAFSKFLNIDIYGFRDGILCNINRNGRDVISYINANSFDHITIYNCLRPIRLINTAKKEDIRSGRSTISSNFFTNITIQHVVENYSAIYNDGSSGNFFTIQLLDWRGYQVEESGHTVDNVYNVLPTELKKVKKF